MVDYWIKSSNIGSIFIPKRTIDSLLLYKSVLKSSQVFSSHVISCIALAHKYFDTSLKMPRMLAHWKNMQFLWPKYWQSTIRIFYLHWTPFRLNSQYHVLYRYWTFRTYYFLWSNYENLDITWKLYIIPLCIDVLCTSSFWFHNLKNISKGFLMFGLDIF